MFVYAFEKLEVWKDARELVVHIYKMTEKFPSEEKIRYGKSNQESSYFYCIKFS
jgi:hypothetical protein